ncbi:hypothetical protein JYQ62_16570 [Nostoc sp. UHCC 0702]|nr:hypothetical protein JYQ62_16570 [Nostoc sp. UHCC 0702]
MNSLKKFFSSAISLAVAISFVLFLTIGFSATAMADTESNTSLIKNSPAQVLFEPKWSINTQCVQVKNGTFTVTPIFGPVDEPTLITSVIAGLDPLSKGRISLNISGNSLPKPYSCSTTVSNNTDLVATCNQGPIRLNRGYFIYQASGSEFNPPNTKLCVKFNVRKIVSRDKLVPPKVNSAGFEVLNGENKTLN